MPLSDAIDWFNERGIPLILNESILAENGIGPDEEVDFRLRHNVTLREQLDLLLEDIGGVRLTYLLKNGIIVITTEEEAEEFLETVIYEVRHLGKNLPADDVLETLQQLTPSPWFEIDGLGGYARVISGGLAIRQTQKNHYQIELVLAQLEEFAAQKNLPRVKRTRKANPPLNHSNGGKWGGGKAGGGKAGGGKAVPQHDSDPKKAKRSKRQVKGGQGGGFF